MLCCWQRHRNFGSFPQETKKIRLLYAWNVPACSSQIRINLGKWQRSSASISADKIYPQAVVEKSALQNKVNLSLFFFPASSFIALVILVIALLSEKIFEKIFLFHSQSIYKCQDYTGTFPVPLSDSSVRASLILLGSSWNMSKRQEDIFQCKTASLQ